MRRTKLPPPNQLDLFARRRARLAGLYAERRRAALLAIGWSAHLLGAALAVRTHAEAWALWLAETRGRGLGRGCWLVELLPGPDTPARADDLLRAAEARGELVRGAFEPSFSQQAFDIGGWLRGTPHRQLAASMWSWMPA